VAGSIVGALLLGFFIGRVTQRSVPARSAHATPAPASDAGVVMFPRKANMDRTLARSSEGSPPARREEALRNVEDPVARLAAERQSASEIGRVVRMIGILSQLSKEEIPNVLAYAVALTGDRREEREIVLFGALSRWAQFDPAAAAEWTRTHASSNLRGRDDDLLEMALSEWTLRDPGAARAWIDQLEDRGQKGGAIRGYLATLAFQNPTLALQQLEQSPEDREQRTYTAIFRAWSSKDPRAAAQAAANLSGADENTRRQALGTVAQIWGEQAPRDAIAWALQLAQPQEQAQLVRNLLENWVQREPDAATAQLLTLPAFIRDDVAHDFVEAIARKDPEDARRIAERFPPGRAREQSLGAVAVSWAGRDPSAAAEFAQNLSQEAAADAWPKIARTWVQRGDPSATAQWVAQLPEGPARSSAAHNVIDSWAKTEPAGAAQWLEQLPSGPTRDAAAATFATEVRGKDPATAMEWAVTVSNVNQRENTVRQVLDAWRKKDPAAAKSWLEGTSAIGADLRSVLLRAP
jgi:hypothetical protein